MCGGTLNTILIIAAQLGLSPRVRGNLVQRTAVPHCGRSIPACAGEPGTYSGSRSCVRVYPRVCGGTHLRQRPVANVPGLSPRVRGNRVGQVVDSVSARSIPACAGEPLGHDADMLVSQVYPRVCGGTMCRQDGVKQVTGLSPRVRGNLVRAINGGNAQGSIPACAGEPLNARALLDRIGVYPRVCGGTARTSALGGSGPGLSPRVRGNRQ